VGAQQSLLHGASGDLQLPGLSILVASQWRPEAGHWPDMRDILSGSPSVRMKMGISNPTNRCPTYPNVRVGTRFGDVFAPSLCVLGPEPEHGLPGVEHSRLEAFGHAGGGPGGDRRGSRLTTVDGGPPHRRLPSENRNQCKPPHTLSNGLGHKLGCLTWLRLGAHAFLMRRWATRVCRVIPSTFDGDFRRIGDLAGARPGLGAGTLPRPKHR
jgi:hypothetical protein